MESAVFCAIRFIDKDTSIQRIAGLQDERHVR
jgi:hypothetical protein